MRVAQSLRDERDAWRTEDRYVWTHLTGVSIWVANGREGLGISSGHNRPAEPRQGALGAADRRHIWRIVKVIWDENEERTRRQALSALSPAHIVGERRK